MTSPSAPQGSQDWLIERAGHATASRFADVLAKIKTGEASTRRKYRLQLVTERLTGLPTSSYVNAAMQHGIDTEPEARRAFEARTGILAIEAPFRKHQSLRWCGASPDGEVDDDGLLEIKCPESMTHVDWLQSGPKLPAEHVPQVQGQMWVTGRQYCDFVSFDPRMPERFQLFTVRVQRDDAYIEALAAGVSAFLDEVELVLGELERFAA